MSPSRGGDASDVNSQGHEGSDPSGEKVLLRARCHVRSLLSIVHVLDALPERSRMLAVDAKLPVHSVLSTVLSEQHPHPQPSRSANAPGPSEESGGRERSGSGGSGGMMRREGHTTATEAFAAPSDSSPKPFTCGVVSPSLPSDLLAEVCELDPINLGPDAAEPGQAPAGEDPILEKQPSVRRWTSPDDGWGSYTGIPITMQDLEKMPMGMPVTVGELADFLAHACEDTEDSRDSGSDMLDWSLWQWRSHRLKRDRSSGSAAEGSSATDGDVEEETSRLELEEGPPSFGQVLVHRVPGALPRPMLCADDPDASLLKAVQLLLAYPSCDALPIVSPSRCTVVAHLTLSYCLAFMLARLRGSDLLPLANFKVRAEESEGAVRQRKFVASASLESGSGSDFWAKPRAAEDQTTAPWVLSSSQQLRELLFFFAQTHHSAVPIVEDDMAKGGVLGLLSRRDLLTYLDLAMETARRSEANPSEPPDGVAFDVTTTLKVVLETLRRFRSPGAADEASSARSEDKASSSSVQKPFAGAALSFEKELAVKHLILRVLGAENRKLLFVQESGPDSSPQLLRILSAGDVWRLLIGSEQEMAKDVPEVPVNKEMS
eukprot:TRINITY_DN18154_c0_g1_i1.p1 TRINITY_DN18154_c0_g1~~TRINITY_DN18154_c0_g1_i1.p1  ORF type:complete len:603 (-),score=109.96 TRINITY_DN18154_c0_g1_i1:167-1975(-)